MRGTIPNTPNQLALVQLFALLFVISATLNTLSYIFFVLRDRIHYFLKT